MPGCLALSLAHSGYEKCVGLASWLSPLPSLTIGVRSPGPTWKERGDLHKMSSDLCLHSHGDMCEHACAHTHIHILINIIKF